MARVRFLFLALFSGGCGASGAAELSTQHGAAADVNVHSAEPEAVGKPGDPELGAMRLKPETCSGIDLEPDYKELGVDDLVQFLRSKGSELGAVQLRGDLTYLDVRSGGGSGLLRVATLESSSAARRDLHEAILQHGPGAWGVHRSNVAVLGPIGALSDVLGFAVRTRLACWGVLVVAGRDDDFVVPGGYSEL
jgi:hypothetical protein